MHKHPRPFDISIGTKSLFQLSIAFLLVLATSCGGDSGAVDSLDELKEKYEQASGECETWIITEKGSSNSSSKGECNDDATLSWFPSRTATLLNVLKVQSLVLSMAESYEANSDDLTLEVVIGDNWMISGAEDEVKTGLAKVLGGSIINVASVDATRDIRRDLAKSSKTGGMAELMPACTDKPLSDDGASVYFDTKGNDDSSGDSYFDVVCALQLLEAPTYVLDLISSTRALDGRQSESWDQFRATWGYHPDSGLGISIIYEK